MRIAFLGEDGAISRQALAALVGRHEVVAVIGARSSPTSLAAKARRAGRRVLEWAGLRTNALADLARAAGAAWHVADSRGAPLDEWVARANADVICSAAYPWMIPEPVLRRPPLGAVNVHGSLLPRHRGVLPLFWVYYCDDREAGVTVHRMNARADTGPILAQEAFALPRGLPVSELNDRNAALGGRLVLSALDAVAGGVAGLTQDETRATRAPWVAQGQRMVDFDHWDAERVWHFLSGLSPYFREPLSTATNDAVQYTRVTGWHAEDHRRQVGTIERGDRGWLLFCRKGVVELC